MTRELDKKLNDICGQYVVRKDLVKLVKGNAAVPSYVLEFLLGQNCAGDDEAQINAGVERVKEILAKHYVQRAEAGAIRSDIKQRGEQRVIDKVSVALNEKRDAYEATFENLGIDKVLVDSETVNAHRRLLVSGVWCIADVGYSHNEAKNESSFLLRRLKPIQLSSFDFDNYVANRSQFTMDEWIDVLIGTIGLNPEELGRRSKLFMLTRLIAYCERNYNLVELGPKGTGKSHVYSEFSPHGILISGGEVTAAKLFVNNSTGKIGLVGYWDCVAFDEFAGKNKRPKADIVDIMKNYMANKSFSRGIEQLNAEASMVFVGNTSHDVGYMINKTDLFEDLPTVYHDPAFIDRLHAYIPGWEMDIIRGDMYNTGYGFVVDYLAEALRTMRGLDYSGIFRDRFELSDTLSTRDRDGVCKTYSGLMKIIFPGKNATAEEEAAIIELALEMRARVKDQLYRIDETFTRSDFAYRPIGGRWRRVATLEELDYPEAYHLLDRVPFEEPTIPLSTATFEEELPEDTSHPVANDNEPTANEPGEGDGFEAEPAAGKVYFRENQRGVSFDGLFGPYLKGAHSIEIVDPYVRTFHQARNLMEFLETCLRHRDWSGGDIAVHLTTGVDQYDPIKQNDYLQRIADAMEPQGLSFTWTFSDTIHDRCLRVDDSWDITLGRGLDIYQRFDSNDAFAVENRMPDMRRVKEFAVVYTKM